MNLWTIGLLDHKKQLRNEYGSKLAKIQQNYQNCLLSNDTDMLLHDILIFCLDNEKLIRIGMR